MFIFYPFEIIADLQAGEREYIIRSKCPSKNCLMIEISQGELAN
jgi:hypothetical protein